jgi:hypothetical protein
MTCRAVSLFVFACVPLLAIGACHHGAALQHQPDGALGVGGSSNTGDGGATGTGGDRGDGGATGDGGSGAGGVAGGSGGSGSGGTSGQAGGSAGSTGTGGGSGGTAFTRVISLAAPVTYAARSPQVVTLADLDTDGKLDAATASFDGRVSVFLGNPNGTFQAEKTYNASSETPGVGIVAADFNNDGKPDLAVSQSRFGFGVLLGKGDGTFQSAGIGVSESTEGGMVATDFNHDGKMGILLASHDVADVFVISGNGDGTFQQFPPSYNVARGIFGGLVLIDFNKDGKLDVVTAGSGAVSVAIGNGDGTFLPPASYPVGSGTIIRSVAVGDLDGDGVLDAVAPDSDTGITLNVFLGKGDGTLRAATQVPCGNSPADVKIVDLNLDGKADIIATNDGGPGHTGTVAVLPGKGDGTFEPFLTFPTGGGGPHSVAIADLNADGLPDLVIANKDDSTSIGVLINNSH